MTTDILLIVAAALVIVASGEQDSRGFCLRCYCSQDFSLVQCDGMNLKTIPTIPSSIRPKVRFLGLQRNHITQLAYDDLAQLISLEKVDVSHQLDGCVYLDFAEREQSVSITGKCTH